MVKGMGWAGTWCAAAAASSRRPSQGSTEEGVREGRIGAGASASHEWWQTHEGNEWDALIPRAQNNWPRKSCRRIASCSSANQLTNEHALRRARCSHRHLELLVPFFYLIPHRAADTSPPP